VHITREDPTWVFSRDYRCLRHCWIKEAVVTITITDCESRLCYVECRSTPVHRSQEPRFCP